MARSKSGSIRPTAGHHFQTEEAGYWVFEFESYNNFRPAESVVSEKKEGETHMDGGVRIRVCFHFSRAKQNHAVGYSGAP